MTFPPSRGHRAWMSPATDPWLEDEEWCPACERFVGPVAVADCLACGDDNEGAASPRP